jgi:hypothetical protein
MERWEERLRARVVVVYVALLRTSGQQAVREAMSGEDIQEMTFDFDMQERSQSSTIRLSMAMNVAVPVVFIPDAVWISHR